MHFEPLPLKGAWLVRPERITDERGHFARILCTKDFSERGLNGAFVQASDSFNGTRGTVRGMHFQWPPSKEAKLVRCTRGAIVDFLLDLRPGSDTYLQHISVPIDAGEGHAVYIPSGFAHGFQTTADDTVVQYHMTDEYRPDLAAGYRWNDSAFSIQLPLPVSMIATRDATYAAFDRSVHEARYLRGSKEGDSA